MTHDSKIQMNDIILFEKVEILGQYQQLHQLNLSLNVRKRCISNPDFQLERKLHFSATFIFVVGSDLKSNMAMVITSNLICAEGGEKDEQCKAQTGFKQADSVTRLLGM